MKRKKSIQGRLKEIKWVKERVIYPREERSNRLRKTKEKWRGYVGEIQDETCTAYVVMSFLCYITTQPFFSDLLSLCLGPTRPGSSYFIPDPDLLNYCQKTRCYGPPRMFILPGLGPQGSDAQANEPSASPIWYIRGSSLSFILTVGEKREKISQTLVPLEWPLVPNGHSWCMCSRSMYGGREVISIDAGGWDMLW